MKKKMCKYRKTTSVHGIAGGLLKTLECKKKWPKNGGNCPKNTNSKCEIVEPKMVRVRAFISSGALPTMELMGCATISKLGGENDIPCTILIDKKYLKGEK